MYMYKYLPRVGSAGTKLLFTCRSWTHGFNVNMEVEKANWNVRTVR